MVSIRAFSFLNSKARNTAHTAWRSSSPSLDIEDERAVLHLAMIGTVRKHHNLPSTAGVSISFFTEPGYVNEDLSNMRRFQFLIT